MRVVMVNRFAGVGAGAEKHVVGLCGALRSRGHEVRLLSTIDAANVERDGAFVAPAGTDFWRGMPPLRQRAAVAGRAVWNRSAAAAMCSLIERFEPDLVHAHDLYPQLSPSPVVVAARRGVPVVQTIHNYELISASAVDHRGGLLQADGAPVSVRALRTALYLLRRAVHRGRVSAWVAVSKYVAEVFRGHGIEAEVLPNFVQPSSEPPRGFEERSGVAFVGRFTEEKGVRDVLELARRLPDCPVTVAGRGPLADDVLAASRERENVTYAGFLGERQVTELLAAARVAIVPSRWQEPAGLVALEAMAEGTPLVAYASGGLAEYVRDAEAGRVVVPASGALAEGVGAIYGDRATWDRLSAAGRAAAASTHSPERYAERLERVYRSVAS